MAPILQDFYTARGHFWALVLTTLFYTCAVAAFVTTRIADWAETTARWTWTPHARRTFCKMHEIPYH